MKKYFLFGIATLCILITSCGGGISSPNITNQEDAKNYLNGKTFTATPSGDIWFKVKFSNGSYTLWTGVPQYEGWNESSSGNLNIEEGRYVDTGQTYYYVVFGNPEESLTCYKFDISGQALYYYHGEYDNNGIKMTEGDKNPWQ